MAVTARQLGLEFPVFVLERPVAELDRRIVDRTQRMLTGGWLEETRDLPTRRDAGSPGPGCLGFREIGAHMQGALAAGQLPDAVVRVTCQYAKRQRTWFRKVGAAGHGRPADPGLLAAVRRTLGSV